MHEVSVALGIIESVSEEAATNGYRNVRSVHLRIGVMAGIVRDALEFAWELATADSPLSGSRLEIESVPLIVYCATCAREERLASTLMLPCPVCGAAAREIRSGRELQIVAIEVSDEAARDRNQSVDPQQERQACGGTAGPLRA